LTSLERQRRLDHRECRAKVVTTLALASWAWYYLRLDRPIRIIVQTPPDPIVATLLDPGPGGKRPAPALTGDGGRAP
jgi:hypothetical protein